MIPFRLSWVAYLSCALLSTVVVLAAAQPVGFRFEPDANPAVANPYAREVWAEVVTPTCTLVLPAYYDGDRAFAVRARPDAVGTFRLGRVLETRDGIRQLIHARLLSATTLDVTAADTLPAIRRDPANVHRFIDQDGHPFIPVGANVAWAEGECVPFYRDALQRFGAAGLSWMRIWMAHWGGLNLDWVTKQHGSQPAIGNLDPATAERWDAIVQAAEQNHVHLQIVLQHHGQYSTRTNSNWTENPWNAANPGGFLHSPEDFFTSAEARRLTRLKYRYIVARWGWSPAIFAWELFNEVHWVDAMATPEGEAKVGAWHDEMADWLRSIDVYHHLITTSTENLRSPCYDKMDFYQPHLYAADMIVAARRVRWPDVGADRPAFYGEEGDDHLDVPADVKQAGTAVVPPAWASLFGQAEIPAQPWLGADIIKLNRTAELGALARFVAGSGFLKQGPLEPISPVVDTAERVPLRIVGSQSWQRYDAPPIDLTLDGSVPVALADVPRFYASPAHARGLPTHAVFRLAVPRATIFQAHIASVGKSAAQIQFLVDGHVAAAAVWGEADPRPSATQPRDISFRIPAGRHEFEVRNVGDATVEIPAIDTGMKTSTLAAIGQRASDFVAVWIWNRSGVFASAPHDESGTLLLENLPAGEWRVTWWNTFTGVATGTTTVDHDGGTLRLPTPAIARHAAVVVEKVASD